MSHHGFSIGSEVSRKLAPYRPLKIVGVRDGMFVLSDEFGSPAGGAWATDLLPAAI